MKSKVALIICGILVFLIGLALIRPTDKQIVQVKNARCPVSGYPVNGVDTYIYKGKEYNLCSEKCKHPLSENPKKYLSE